MSEATGLTRAAALRSEVPEATFLGLISDIHGNLPALLEVLKAFESLGIGADQIINLGDIFGYGPQVIEIVDRARHWRANLLGNHDFLVYAALRKALENFGLSAVEGPGMDPILRVTVTQADLVAEAGVEAFFDSLRPAQLLTPSLLLIHDSPRSYGKGVIPQDRLLDSHAWQEAFGIMAREKVRWTIHGHNHTPRVLQQAEEGGPVSVHPLSVFRPVAGHRYLVDIGSVGQPRDGDPRAAACVVALAADGEPVEFVPLRLPYPIEKTEAAIRAAGYPELFADRLRHGI